MQAIRGEHIVGGRTRGSERSRKSQSACMFPGETRELMVDRARDAALPMTIEQRRNSDHDRAARMENLEQDFRFATQLL